MSYTKGPWRIAEAKPYSSVIEKYLGRKEMMGVEIDDSYSIAQVMGLEEKHGGRDTMLDNTRLVAAAPALLEAAQQVLEHYGPDAWLDELTAAVEQALGDTP